MGKRHSSSSPSPRPRIFRERSNSFPISDALGCSTPEAELILAEGRAAVRSRLINRERGRRRDGFETFRPKDHIGYLSQGSAVSEAIDGDPPSPPEPRARHARIPSDVTDRSTSTIVAPAQPSVEGTSSSPVMSTSPLGDYSAHLAKFILSQLNSIPTYRPSASISPRSCPDLSFPRSPLQPPAQSVPLRRHVGAPSLIEIPKICPPAKSAFSSWSSTDDDTDDEAPALPDADSSQTTRNTYTPSVLHYYEQSNDSTFLFASTPTEEDEDPDTAKALSFPNNSELPGMPVEPTSTTQDEDYASSAFSRLSLLTSSSAPSLCSISTSSYFEDKMPLPQEADIRDGIIPPGKIIPAISPFEGAALANVHDIFVQSQQRVLVDGMSFDMARNISMPGKGTRQVQASC